MPGSRNAIGVRLAVLARPEPTLAKQRPGCKIGFFVDLVERQAEVINHHGLPIWSIVCLLRKEDPRELARGKFE